MTDLLREIWGTLLKVQRRGFQASRDAVQLHDLLRESEALRAFPNLTHFFDVARVTAFLAWKKSHHINEGFFKNAKAFIEFVDWINESDTIDSFDELCVASREEYRNFLRHVLEYSDDSALPRARFGSNSTETAFDFLKEHYPEEMRDSIHLEQVKRHDPELIAALEEASSGFGAETYFSSKTAFDNRVARAVKMVLDVSLTRELDQDGTPEDDRAVLGHHTASLVHGRSSAAHLEPSSALPAQAPALWKSDKQPGDTPVTFIQRHYAPWLGKGLSRPDIKRLDPPLYMGLHNWLRKNELPDEFDLPTKSEQGDRLLGDLLEHVPSNNPETLRRAAARITHLAYNKK